MTSFASSWAVASWPLSSFALVFAALLVLRCCHKWPQHLRIFMIWCSGLEKKQLSCLSYSFESVCLGLGMKAGKRCCALNTGCSGWRLVESALLNFCLGCCHHPWSPGWRYADLQLWVDLCDSSNLLPCSNYWQLNDCYCYNLMHFASISTGSIWACWTLFYSCTRLHPSRSSNNMQAPQWDWCKTDWFPLHLLLTQKLDCSFCLHSYFHFDWYLCLSLAQAALWSLQSPQPSSASPFQEHSKWGYRWTCQWPAPPPSRGSCASWQLSNRSCLWWSSRSPCENLRHCLPSRFQIYSECSTAVSTLSRNCFWPKVFWYDAYIESCPSFPAYCSKCQLLWCFSIAWMLLLAFSLSNWMTNLESRCFVAKATTRGSCYCISLFSSGSLGWRALSPTLEASCQIGQALSDSWIEKSRWFLWLFDSQI